MTEYFCSFIIESLSLNRNGEVDIHFLKKYHLTNNTSANESFKSVKKMNYLYRKVYCICYSTSDLQSLIASYQRSSMISGSTSFF
jgi:hypothetical protein